MYSHAARGTIEAFTQGFNGTIFAYGQSGSGKTFSMLGPEHVIDVIKSDQYDVSEEILEMQGIIPRAVIDFFEYMNKQTKEKGSNFKVYMNYFEIYKENLVNLLSDKHSNNQDKFKISNNKVLNADPVAVYSPEDVFKQIKKALQNVHFESTNMNQRSSRSHTVLTLSYIQTNKDNSQQSAKLNLVDLAGTERIVKTGVSGITLKEAKEINLSLTQLGIVINKLSEGKKGHIPYRDSKLTHLLKESLGGNSKTTLLCTVSRNSKHLEESIQSLKFAQRVKNIKNKSKSNIENSPELMVKQIKILQEDIQILNKRLNLIRAEPDKIEYYITLEKKQLMIKEDYSSDTPFSEDLIENFSPLSLNTSKNNLKSSKFVSLPDKLNHIGKPFDYYERDPQAMIEELKAEYDNLKKEKEKEIEEYKDRINLLNQQLKDQEILLLKDVQNSSENKKGNVQSKNEQTKNNKTLITNFQKQINTKKKRSNTLRPKLTQLQVSASSTRLFVNQQPSENFQPSIYPIQATYDQTEESQLISGQDTVDHQLNLCAFNQITSLAQPIFHLNEFCVQEHPNDDQEMDELLKFILEIQDNVQSVFSNTHDNILELKDCESNLSLSIDQKQNQDQNVDIIQYSLMKSIDIALHMHQLYKIYRKRSQNWRDQVQSSLDQLQAKQLLLKANQQDKESIRNLEQRISCLLQEIKEWEDQLTKCTDKIVQLEQSNQQLKELVVEIENDEEQQCKLKLNQLIEESLQKHSNEQNKVLEQNQFFEIKISQLEMYIEKLEIMQKDYEDRLLQMEQKLADDQQKLQSDQIFMQQQCQQIQELHKQIDNMVDKVMELTAENKIINEQRISQTLQIKNLQQFFGNDSSVNIEKMPFKYHNELGELDHLEQQIQNKEISQITQSADCSLQKVEAELQQTYFECNQDKQQIENSFLTESSIDAQKANNYLSHKSPAIAKEKNAVRRMYTMRHELFNELQQNQIKEESQEEQIDSIDRQVNQQLSYHILDNGKYDYPIFKIASDYKNSFDQVNDSEDQIQNIDKNSVSISELQIDVQYDHQIGSCTTCNTFEQAKNDFQFLKYFNMKQNRENRVMMLNNKLASNNFLKANYDIQNAQIQVSQSQNRNLTTENIDLGHLEVSFLKERRLSIVKPTLNFADPVETISQKSSQKQFTIKEVTPEEEFIGSLYQFFCEKYQDIVFEHALDRDSVSYLENSEMEDYQQFIMCVMNEVFQRQFVSVQYFNTYIFRETKLLYQEAKNMKLKHNEFQEFINKNLARFRLNELDRKCSTQDLILKHNEFIEKQQSSISDFSSNDFKHLKLDRKIIGNRSKRQKCPIDNFLLFPEEDKKLLKIFRVLESESSISKKLLDEQTQSQNQRQEIQWKNSNQQLSQTQMCPINNKLTFGQCQNQSSINIEVKKANDNVNTILISQMNHKMTETPNNLIESKNIEHEDHQSSCTVFDQLFNLLKLKSHHSEQNLNKEIKVDNLLQVQSNETLVKTTNKSNQQFTIKCIRDSESSLEQLFMMD